jgi:hypothetical protein
MQYLVEAKTVRALRVLFPCEPEDLDKSVADYLEDKLEDGWELVSIVSPESNPRFVFKQTHAASAGTGTVAKHKK